jgi:hypothetical protein
VHKEMRTEDHRVLDLDTIVADAGRLLDGTFV